MNGTVGSSFSGVTFSPDGRLIAGAAELGYIVIWDRASGKVRSLRQGVKGVAFTSDSQWLIANSTKQVSRWKVDPDSPGDALSETAVILGESDANTAESKVSSDGRCFSFLTSKGARFVSLTETPGRLESLTKETRMRGGSNSNAVISPNERFLACTQWDPNKTEIYDFRRGEMIATLDSFGGGAQFRPDCQELVIINKEEVVFWNTTDWSRVAIYRRPGIALRASV
ncbi:MAG: WD40 repeat protein [Pseudoalteromonas tetraodonis]|jgi:WD40 repeat protein